MAEDDAPFSWRPRKPIAKMSREERLALARHIVMTVRLRLRLPAAQGDRAKPRRDDEDD
ncbi:hypothetical protein [Sinomonas gamaensis]|uniref:hypothetical protein n=1 Tax=Sinomonas gamaensis TaxID=2565624 RepID=UPI00148625E4|nr:hypothetical protein [Sinomonas gamaensis]